MGIAVVGAEVAVAAREIIIGANAGGCVANIVVQGLGIGAEFPAWISNGSFNFIAFEVRPVI